MFELSKGWLFTNVGAYGGAVIAIFNPFFGLLIYVCFAIVRPAELWHFSVTPGPHSRIVGIALLIGWILRGMGDWRWGRGHASVICLLLWFGWSALSGQVGFAVSDAALVQYLLESQLKFILPFLVGVTLIDSLEKLKQFAWTIVVSQGYVAYELNVRYYLGFNWYLIEYGFGGMDNNCVAISMVACTGVAFFLGLHSENPLQKALALAAALLMAHAIMFSQSRGGMLALLIMGGIIFVLIPKQPQHYLIFAVLVAVCWRLAGEGVVERFMSAFAEQSARDASASNRVQLWADAWDVMLKHPFVGCGLGHWPAIAHTYGWNYGKHIHSLWLSVGAETGFPGLIFLILFYVFCLKRLLSIARGKVPVADEWYRHFARMVIASIIGFAVAGQFVSLPGLEVPYYVNLLGVVVLKFASVPSGVVSSAAVRAPYYGPVPSYPAYATGGAR